MNNNKQYDDAFDIVVSVIEEMIEEVRFKTTKNTKYERYLTNLKYYFESVSNNIKCDKNYFVTAESFIQAYFVLKEYDDMNKRLNIKFAGSLRSDIPRYVAIKILINQFWRLYHARKEV